MTKAKREWMLYQAKRIHSTVGAQLRGTGTLFGDGMREALVDHEILKLMANQDESLWLTPIGDWIELRKLCFEHLGA